MGKSRPNYLPQRQKLTELVLHYEESSFAESHPALYQLLCHARDAEGNYRAGASLSFFADAGSLKASLYDRATSMVWFLTLSSSEDLLGAVEKALQEGRGEWRTKKK